MDDIPPSFAMLRRVAGGAALFCCVVGAWAIVDAARAAEPASEPAWRVGLAKVDVTPTLPVWLAGYSGIRDPDGALHPLWAKAIAFEAADGGRAVLITSDFQGVPASMSDRVFARLAAEHGLDRSRVMFAYSHNHCSPRLGDDLIDYYPVDPAQEAVVARYTAECVDACVSVVAQALAALAPAEIRVGAGRAGFAVNRRDNVEEDVPKLLARGEPLRGVTDHSVPVLTVTRPDGRLDAVLFGYACHPTTLVFRTYCGDYPGFAQLAIEKSHPGTMALFVNTCGGDQNPVPRRSLELCERYGLMLAAGVEEALRQPMEPVSCRLRTAFEMVQLDYEKVADREELEAAAGGTHALKARWGRRLLAKLAAGETFPTSYPYPLHAWRLGEGTLFIGMGGETVVDYALRFKKRWGPGTWVLGYTDDMAAYIPSRRVWEEGGYEGGSTLYEYGRYGVRWAGTVDDTVDAGVTRVVEAVGPPVVAPVGRWPLGGDARSTVSATPHGEPGGGVRFESIAGRVAARFDGRGGMVTIPSAAPLRLGSGDFTITAWVHTEPHVDDDLGDILAHFDPASRTGLHLGLRTNAGVTSSQANERQLQFGIDAGTEPVFADEGRPGDAIFGQSMAVHEGRLYVGSCVPGGDQAGHVHRYDAPGRWQDLGSPDKANSITAMAAWNGSLYVGSGKYRLAGTHLEESTNPHTGGRIYRLLPDDTWELVGELPGVEAVGGMVVFRGRLHAGSLYKPAGLFRLDGDGRWTPLSLPDGKRVVSLGRFHGDLLATSYDNGNVYRFDGDSWEDLGQVGDNTQTYGFAVHRGRLQVATWPSGRVFERDGTEWADKGRLGEEKEVMGMLVHNGSLYAGTLPLAQVYRHDGDRAWKLIQRLDTTPDVEYRRVWTMAQHDGRLFATTIPSGRVWSMRTGACVTWDRPFPPGWHHVAAQRAGGALRLLVDGELVAESHAVAADSLDVDCAAPWTIGGGSGDFFHGGLADVQVHRRALSQAEISAAVRSTPGEAASAAK